ncbi:MAG: hypothetical protein IMW89_20595 [Ktedonobacteraceae bacterium]|nr:hypothetical protein [Ktedonobacteraceae bacterium]
MEILLTLGNVVLWSLLSIIIAGIISILIVTIVLGIKISDLITEIETKQNAAIGIIFKNVAAVLSGLLLIFTSTGFSSSEGLLSDILWTVGGGLLTLLFTGILGFLFLNWLSGKRASRETPLQYLRRELVLEQNEALAHIIMAFFIVVGITMIGQII